MQLCMRGGHTEVNPEVNHESKLYTSLLRVNRIRIVDIISKKINKTFLDRFIVIAAPLIVMWK